jgi:hypothetical protein
VAEKNHKSRLVYGKMSRDVEHSMSAVHIARAWDLLLEKFCFNTKLWKKEFYEYYQKQPQNISESEAFVDFGTKHIQPLLNMVLKRNAFHPTWKNLLTYIVKKY